MSTSTVATIVASFISDLGTILSTNLPSILTIVASLFGLTLIIRWAKRHLSAR